MSGGGYQVDPEALARITKGINQAMDELKDFGFDIEANLGRGFGGLQLEGLEVGDAGLHQVFAGFCERWGWGVRSLMQDANGFAERLNLSAGLYHEQEQYASNTLKGVWTAAMGNPGLSPEQAEQRSWSETFRDNAVSQVAGADYSAGSFTSGGEEIGQAWAQAEEDVETSTVTPDALFDPRTDWQWGGPPQPRSESFQPKADTSGEAER
ncbi:hypothetical protein GCM10022403_025060 [Streptomyces coacervatus]|uniref:Uncharacterized protein n=1 Tax=Streptomyces coacervatus TaxID=647381 RepID=A0ABP7HAV9_9ACTN|nr:hypothetical protein [Streptomyces coacervatus]MDF2265748.1 hypothetical protein [Streptomyces coacervatus]